MSKYLRFCPTCNAKDINQEHIIRGRYSTYLEENNYVCEVCGNKVKDLSILSQDYKIIVEISNNPKFIESMIKLHDEDIVEYQLKMSQFKAQLSQIQVQRESSKPHCPHCKSTNIKPISNLNRASSIAMWGIFSKKINKSFECLNCKYTW